MRVFAGSAMGSPLRLQVDGAADLAEAGWQAVVETFRAVDASLSRFSPLSELSRLNQAAGSGRWLAVSPLLRSALAGAEFARRATNGAFDARVIVALEALGEQAGVWLPPAPRVPGRTRLLELDGVRARIAAPVDLGGLGKGLALRLARRRLRRLGVNEALLEAGGDVVSCGPIARWRVGIEDPWHPRFPLAGVELGTSALATSSTAVRRWRDDAGWTVHHLIDPATGQPGGHGLVAVTLLAHDPVRAEVWSKALFLAGVDGIAHRAARAGLAAWWVRDDQRMDASTLGRAVERFRLRPAERRIATRPHGPQRRLGARIGPNGGPRRRPNGPVARGSCVPTIAVEVPHGHADAIRDSRARTSREPGQRLG